MRSVSEARDGRVGLSSVQITLGIFGLIAPVLTFVLAVSALPDPLKIFVLVVLAVGYSVICFWSFRRSIDLPLEVDQQDPSESLDDALRTIGSTSEFFGASLEPEDLFRLVSSRVSQVFPFVSSALFVQAEVGGALEIVQADGPNAEALMSVELPTESGIADLAWHSREAEIDPDLKLEMTALPPEALEGIRSAVAMPLMHDRQPFAVLVLYRSQPVSGEPSLRGTLEAIGERVAPLFLTSISFERSVSNALTDGLTNLPNERAFFMVLENQLAESQRSRDDRPLTIMSIDIKNFADVNQNFGFATGDRMLAFTAEHLLSQLRKMDFLARSNNDEFLIILPTAPEKIGREIIERIRDRFASEFFPASESEDIKVWLNFGWATFWQDGETATQLLQHARIRKQQAKAEEPAKVLWFPKEYVN